LAGRVNARSFRAPVCVLEDLRSRYSAVNYRRFGLATPPEALEAGTENPLNVMQSLSPTIDLHLPPPYSNCRSCCLAHVDREDNRLLEQYPESVQRIRYEDMTTSPEDLFGDQLSFLDPPASEELGAALEQLYSTSLGTRMDRMSAEEAGSTS